MSNVMWFLLGFSTGIPVGIALLWVIYRARQHDAHRR